MKQYVLQNILKIKPMYSAGRPKMKQYVLQNITKTKPVYSVGCPTDEAVCSSEYAEDQGNMFF
jgi:hypothetical protein